jgi:hypothetical protein
MGFKLGSFIGGVAKGANESIEELEKLNTTSINASIKSMYHNHQEYKKEIEKQKETIRGPLGVLRSLKFSDGLLSDEQLIGLATNPSLAKEIAETLTKNPDKLEGLSKSFITASNIPKGKKFDEFLNEYGKKAALSAEEFAQIASNKEEGFLNKMIYGDNLKKITSASRQLGVKPEELYAYGSSKSMPTYEGAVQVDFAKLQKTPEFKDLKDKAMVVMYRAKQEGTDEEILAAAKNMGAIKGTELMAELKEKPKESQQDIEIDYGKRILAATDPKQKAKLTAELRTQQDLWANPSLKKLTEGEKITTGNKLVGYKGIINSTVANYLPPGTFKTNPITGDLEVSELVKSGDFAKGKKAGMEAAIAFGTGPDGKPKSNEDRLALASVGIQFYPDGKAFAPKVEFAVEAAPAPVAPPNRSVRGGPMAPKPKPDSAAPAMPPRFNTPNVAPVDKATARAQANAAIANKAPAAEVAKRFKETYGEDL